MLTSVYLCYQNLKNDGLASWLSTSPELMLKKQVFMQYFSRIFCMK
jgi:elongation factor P--beta-lysine ligase